MKFEDYTPVPLAPYEPKNEIDIPLLRKTLEHIKAHPEEWDQSSWRCDTGMCFAGWAVTLVGREWATPKDHPAASFVEARPGEPEACSPGRIGYDNKITLPKVIMADAAAIHELGIDEDTADYLFDGSNSIETLEVFLDEIERTGSISEKTYHERSAIDEAATTFFNDDEDSA